MQTLAGLTLTPPGALRQWFLFGVTAALQLLDPRFTCAYVNGIEGLCSKGFGTSSFQFVRGDRVRPERASAWLVLAIIIGREFRILRVTSLAPSSTGCLLIFSHFYPCLSSLTAEETCAVTSMALPARGHLDGIRRLLVEGYYIGRGSRWLCAEGGKLLADSRSIYRRTRNCEIACGRFPGFCLFLTARPPKHVTGTP